MRSLNSRKLRGLRRGTTPAYQDLRLVDSLKEREVTPLADKSRFHPRVVRSGWSGGMRVGGRPASVRKY
jgi:hypothetical protein